MRSKPSCLSILPAVSAISVAVDTAASRTSGLCAAYHRSHIVWSRSVHPMRAAVRAGGSIGTPW